MSEKTKYRNYEFEATAFMKNDNVVYKIYCIGESPDAARYEAELLLKNSGLKDYTMNASSFGSPVQLGTKNYYKSVWKKVDPFVKKEIEQAAKVHEEDIKSAKRSAKLTVGADKIQRMKHMI
jgi:hypothetical protein